MSDQLISSETRNAAVRLEISETLDDGNDTVVMGYQQPTAIVSDSNNGGVPHDEEDYLDRRISELRSAYDKLTDDTKLLNLVTALIAAISGNQRKGEQMERKRVILSAIVSGGGIVALLCIYFQQFRLLRRIRQLKKERKSLADRTSRSIRSEMREGDDDLDFRWFAQRAAFVAIFIALFIDLFLSLV